MDHVFGREWRPAGQSKHLHQSDRGGAPNPSPDGVPWRTDIKNGELTIPGVAIPPTTEANWKYATEMGFKQPTPTIEGPLYKFCKNPDAVHCPGDKRYQMALGSGYSWDSYSGATFLNGETRANANNLTKRTAVNHPSDRFIWIEGADMRGENIGSWNLSAYGTAAANFTDAAFGDSPAAFHITSAVFNFCDGHAESHKWHDGATISFANDPSVTGKDNGSDGMRGLANHPNNSDLQWVGSHYPGNQNP
jgi:hypothetical protein